MILETLDLRSLQRRGKEQWPSILRTTISHYGKTMSHRPHICLVQPEIPQNTGAIGRLAAATGCPLHLVKPLGFSLDDRYMKRAGLDYWPYLDLHIHENFERFLDSAPKQPRLAFFSTKAEKLYWDLPETDVIIFGRETSGLPEELRERYAEHFYRIPMFHPKVRSLNLANSVSIVVYQQLELQHRNRNSSSRQ